MNFQIVNYQGTLEEDREITSLLTSVFVGEGYTDKSESEQMFVPAELRKRGEIILAKSPGGKILGMIIFVRSTSSASQVAEGDETEIHLLAVCPETRNQGIASRLIMTCERRAVSLGYSKMILSTQRTMKAAHHLYEQLGYIRNSARDWSKGTGKTYFVYEKFLRI